MVRMGDAAPSYRKGTVLKGCVVLAMGVSCFHFISNRDRKQVHAIKSQGPPPFPLGLHLRVLEPIQTAITGGLVQPVNLSGTFHFETATYPFLKYSGTTDQYLPLHPSAFVSPGLPFVSPETSLLLPACHLGPGWKVESLMTCPKLKTSRSPRFSCLAPALWFYLGNKSGLNLCGPYLHPFIAKRL